MPFDARRGQRAQESADRVRGWSKRQWPAAEPFWPAFAWRTRKHASDSTASHVVSGSLKPLNVCSAQGGCESRVLALGPFKHRVCPQFAGRGRGSAPVERLERLAQYLGARKPPLATSRTTPATWASTKHTTRPP